MEYQRILIFDVVLIKVTCTTNGIHTIYKIKIGKHIGIGADHYELAIRMIVLDGTGHSSGCHVFA